MHQVVPPRFLFRWSFTAKRISKIPASSGRLLNLPDECRLPSLGELDQQKDFAHLRLAWNDAGFGLSVSVEGKSRLPKCAASDLTTSDGIRVWFDTRNTQTVHRATRFCHQFVILPTGTGPKKSNPLVRSLPVLRAREETPLPNWELVQAQSEATQSGYWIDIWFPAEVFTGYDPSTIPRIGFHYLVRDSELGDQTLAVGSEFPYESDPSLWQNVDLES